MPHKISYLNGDFGAMIDGVRREDLASSDFKQQALKLWTDQGGLIGLRGDDLAHLTPDQLMDWSACFGLIDYENFVARAPEHVVAKDRARVEELQTMLAQMNESLDRVKEMAQA